MKRLLITVTLICLLAACEKEVPCTITIRIMSVSYQNTEKGVVEFDNGHVTKLNIKKLKGLGQEVEMVDSLFSIKIWEHDGRLSYKGHHKGHCGDLFKM